ncbi:hypothetical protein GCM10007922_22140 [Shewanella decolorationis]|uniref:Uncharacterized protein n=1 Tax=Shewanella decolorationis TaxID=256839 RepID=A0A5B8QT08_9GAMM|nr:hypothetical protein GCM10007922_22140 [Shewanella decolorationis]
MAQAQGYMDVPSEPLGNFYWSMRPLTNACNFARGVLADVKTIGKEDRMSSPPWSTPYKNQGVKPHDFDFDFE